MILLLSIAVALLFGVGVFLILERDVIKLAVGTALTTNAAILFVMSPAVPGQHEAIAPWPSPTSVSDPLAQALALTGIVIGFAVSALLLRVVVAVEEAHGTIDMEDLGDAEVEHEDRLREEGIL